MQQDLPKLGILAGGGSAPRQIVQACQDAGRPFFIVCLEGHADAELAACIAAQGLPHEVVALGSLQKFKALCVREAIGEIVMIGRVRRPSVTEIKPDWLALKVLAKIGFHALGDDGLLRSLGKVLEEECGVKLVGASEIMTELLTPAGTLTNAAPNDQDLLDIKRGCEIARTLGALDVGQAVIVQQGFVLGVEAAEGTAALIARAGTLRRAGGGGVLVKLAKPQQDHRFDLPSVGPDTIAQLKEAGLAGVALEAARSLLLEREATLAAAHAAGLFVVGIEGG